MISSQRSSIENPLPLLTPTPIHYPFVRPIVEDKTYSPSFSDSRFKSVVEDHSKLKRTLERNESSDTLSQFPRSQFNAPSYRNKSNAEKLLASHLASLEKESLDGIQTERSQRIVKESIKTERETLLADDSFEDQPTKRERKTKVKQEKKKSTAASLLEQPSILENVEEVGNFELFGRILSGYYENMSLSFRRILLNLGSKIDKQRDAEIRRVRALTQNVLSTDNPELKEIDAEISKIDKQNFLNMMVVLAIVAFILTLLFR